MDFVKELESRGYTTATTSKVTPDAHRILNKTVGEDQHHQYIKLVSAEHIHDDIVTDQVEMVYVKNLFPPNKQ